MQRLQQIRLWLNGLFPGRAYQLTAASADASFRRYFRLSFTDDGDGGNELSATRIIMDAPPEQENCAAFVKIAALMHAAGVNTPQIIAQDSQQGFLLLSDLGTQTYLDVINEKNANALFGDAVDALIKWQLASRPDVLPPYDETLLRRELMLFPDWFVARHLQQTLTVTQLQALEEMFTLIVRNNLAQPSVYVHRDYMPRNLMLNKNNPGVLDFQDAVSGPISYDVASLFKDAFISWEEERVLDWTIRYWEKAKRAGLPVDADFGTFYRDCEWMGVQRHLKVLGIFARINYRDGKPHYLADAPRFINYVRHTAQRYNALAPLLHLFDELENREIKTGLTF